MKTKHKALLAVALLMSAAAQAFPVVVARPVIVPLVSTPHVSVAPPVTPTAHMTPATHVAAVPHINPGNAEPRVLPTVHPSAAERHAAHVTPAVPVINVPAPLRKRCADQASRECLQ